MAQELRFPDPAFTCEVVLTGPAKALYDVNKQQFERLRKIKSLGLAAHISDIAIHTRHSHVIGLMKIFDKLCQQPKRQGLPKQFLWSFWCRLCFGQTGHAALSYDSEKAVLLACHMDPTFKDSFRTFLQPINERLSRCLVCNKHCTAKDKDSAAAALWFDDLVQKNRWRSVYLWIAALKLIQDTRVLNILKQRAVNQENAIGFSEPEVLKMLVSPECLWDQTFYRLNRLDYVVRDLTFAGTLSIRVDIDGLIASAGQNHPDWELLRYLDSYLEMKLYESVPAQTASVLFQRSLADMLLSGKLSIKNLFGFDTGSDFGDERLANFLMQNKAGREVFTQEIQGAWRTWPISCFVDSKHTPCEVEQEITGQTKLHLSSHTRNRVTCLTLAKDNYLGLSMCHLDQATRPAARTFIKLCRSILLKKYPRLNSEHLTAALYEGLINRPCEHGLTAAAERYAQLEIPQNTLQGAAEVIRKRSITTMPDTIDMSIRIGDFNYPLEGNLSVTIMHSAIKGNDKVRKDLNLTIAKAAEILWSQLLNWQSIYFGLRPTHMTMRLLEEAQKLLADRVVNSIAPAENDLELYTFIEALKHPAQSVSFRIVLPNLKILKEDRNIENEYDVVSLLLKEDKNVEVWIWGVTTENDIVKKRNADHAKIQKLKDLLGNRWGGEIRTVENYIHKDGNNICCEIDGQQEKRPVT